MDRRQPEINIRIESRSRSVTTVLGSMSQWRALGDGGVWIAAIIYVAVFTGFSIYRFSLMGDCYDLSVFEQSFWSTVNEGLPLYNSQEGPRFGRFSHFSAHFSPLLFLVTPFYWLWQRPEALLFAKTVALALGAFPLYKLATLLLGSREAGRLVAFTYLLYPPLHGVNMWGFHENEFAVAPLLFLLLCYERGQWTVFWILLFAVLGVKENIALTMAAFGLYLSLFRRERMLGAAVAGTSVLWLLAAQWIIIPLAQGKNLFEIDSAYFLSRYDPIVGQSYGEIFWNLVHHPIRIAQYVFGSSEKRIYLFQIFFPLAFIPLAAPEALALSAPVLAQNLLSRYWGQYAILAQYSAEMIPFLFYGLCLGIARIERWRRLGPARRIEEPAESIASDPKRAYRRTSTRLLAVVFAAVLVANFFSGVWTFAIGRSDFLLAIAKPPERRRAALELMALIPKEASVITDVSMISHLGGREWLHAVNQEPFHARDWDYVLLDSQFPWIGDISPNEVVHTLQSKRYQSIALEGIFLFKRPGAPERRKD